MNLLTQNTNLDLKFKLIYAIGDLIVNDIGIFCNHLPWRCGYFLSHHETNGDLNGAVFKILGRIIKILGEKVWGTYDQPVYPEGCGLDVWFKGICETKPSAKHTPSSSSIFLLDTPAWAEPISDLLPEWGGEVEKKLRPRRVKWAKVFQKQHLRVKIKKKIDF